MLIATESIVNSSPAVNSPVTPEGGFSSSSIKLSRKTQQKTLPKSITVGRVFSFS
jgi:hypothetical protein